MENNDEKLRLAEEWFQFAEDSYRNHKDDFDFLVESTDMGISQKEFV